MQNNVKMGSFKSLGLGNQKPVSAHPEDYYVIKEARVAVAGELTLHFLKDGNNFLVTLYANCGVRGDAGAIELGSVRVREVGQAVESGSLFIEGREFQFAGDTRALRRIL